MSSKIRNLIFFATIVLSFFIVASSKANFALIRDAETEKFLHQLADPIFVAAHLEPKNIHIFIVNDDSINAFVSGGQNVFINTGLIRKYNKPNALIGVLAHETGHIAAGHIARSYEAMKNASNTMLLSYLLGIGAAVSGSPEAAQALILGGGQVAEKLFMKYSRNQEEAADKYAVQILSQINYPANGLLELLEFFDYEMIGYRNIINEYAMSHPVSRKRIDFLKNNIIDKKFSDKKTNQQLQPLMDVVITKLEAFIDDPDIILRKYKNRDDYLAKYAKAIVFHRKGDSIKSLKLMDEVIAQNPRDGFLYELRGQIMYESGMVNDAIVDYDKAIELLSPKDAAQSKIAFSVAILTLHTNDSELISLAIKNLKEAQIFESENPFLFKQFAVAYNKIGDEGRSLLALAEYNYLSGDKKKAKNYAKEAKDKLNKTTDKTELTRLEDLIEIIKDEQDKNDTVK